MSLTDDVGFLHLPKTECTFVAPIIDRLHPPRRAQLFDRLRGTRSLGFIPNAEIMLPTR